MKFCSNFFKVFQFNVAPLVGAWIEIISVVFFSSSTSVAPLVGAWIEIVRIMSGMYINNVAPLVGAWIEMKF